MRRRGKEREGAEDEKKMGRDDNESERSVGWTSRRSSLRSGMIRETFSSEDRLSNEEVKELKRMILDKERKEKSRSIKIKGLELERDREDIRKRLEELFKETLKVEGEIEKCIRSGEFLFVHMKKEETKWEIMRKKYRLKEIKDRRIFIEQDLSWEERRMQDRIKGR